MDNNLNDKILFDSSTIGKELNETVNFLLSLDKIRNENVIELVNKIDSLKKDLDSLKLDIVREYFR